MPRCLMAKKWKAYPWSSERLLLEPPQTDDEEIDVVGDGQTGAASSTSSHHHQQQHHHHHQAQPQHHPAQQQQSHWGPHSPTAGATAPSPPPLNASGALYYHGYTHEPSWINHEDPPKYATLRSAAELAQPLIPSPTHLHEQQPPPEPQEPPQQQQPPPPTVQQQPINVPPRKSLSMCFTSTGTALSLPPKKKDIYRPYSLQPSSSEIRSSPEEDLSAAQAILDLSASPAAPSHSIFIHTLSPPPPAAQPQPIPVSVLVPLQPPPPPPPAPPQQQQLPVLQPPQPLPPPPPPPQASPPAPQSPEPTTPSTAATTPIANATSKTVAYTYEAFFVSDGRSKRRTSSSASTAATAASNASSSSSNSSSVNAAAVVCVEKELVGQQPDRPKFTCTECGKQYATSSNLSRHKQTHRSLDSQSAKKCIHCGKAYVSMPALAMHVLTHKLAHSCGVCGKMFSRPWLLQGHLRSHTGEKPYGCAHCGKAFADRSNLRAHMQTHSADKNYECSRCHKTFALKSYLNKHLESACLRDDEALPPANTTNSPSPIPPQQQSNQRGL